MMMLEINQLLLCVVVSTWQESYTSVKHATKSMTPV